MFRIGDGGKILYFWATRPAHGFNHKTYFNNQIDNRAFIIIILTTYKITVYYFAINTHQSKVLSIFTIILFNYKQTQHNFKSLNVKH